MHISLTFNIYVGLNSGSVSELYLLALNILTARFCIRFSRFAWCPHVRIPWFRCGNISVLYIMVVSSSTVFTSLFDTIVTFGFQFRCLFRFMHKELKLFTNSIDLIAPFIFIVGTIIFFCGI